jgi:MoxR-like ATPase
MATDPIVETPEALSDHKRLFAAILAEQRKVIVGQEHLLWRLLLGLLCGGHLLIEGVPGLAKTLAVKTLAGTIDATFHRIQCTPDLLPADLIGTMVYNAAQGTFSPHFGPVFTDLLLVDEINRAPAKVQSALLEAMQEHQVSIGSDTHPLSDLFMVLATQNPIEHDGTYPLPEAQVDRFMLKIVISYPSPVEEKQVVREHLALREPEVDRVARPEDLLAARRSLASVQLEEPLMEYIVRLVLATREPDRFDLADLGPLIAYGASPRASIYLALAARAVALLDGRDYVLPDDVKDVALDVMRHRIILTYEAEAERVTTDDLLRRILSHVALP